MVIAILLKHVSVKEQYRNFQYSKFLTIESQNHRMTWVERDF